MILKMYAEAKGTGFDAKVMRKIVSIRRQDKSKRQEEEEILTSISQPWVWSRAQLFGPSFILRFLCLQPLIERWGSRCNSETIGNFLLFSLCSWLIGVDNF